MQEAAARLRTEDVALLIVSDNKQAVQKSSEAGAPLHHTVIPLWDKDNLVRRQFLVPNSDIPQNQPLLLAIDRAGYVRLVQALDDTEDIGPALQHIGDPTPRMEVGQPAPEFAIADMNGQTRSLKEFRGKKHLLLTFFPRCFTGNCKAQLTALRDEYSTLQANGLEVLAVSTDAAEGDKGQRAYAKYLNLPFDLLSDTGRHLSILYGAANSPNQMAARQSVLIDKDGIVRWIDKQVSPATHGADVLTKINDLGMAR